jgi:hypothetical protein
MKFLKSMKCTPEPMMLSLAEPATFGISSVGSGPGTVDAIITDEAMEQIADKVFTKCKTFLWTQPPPIPKFSDQLSVIQEKATLGQCFYTMAKFGLGVKYCTINQEASPGEAVETHLQITFTHDPSDAKSVQSIASLVSWASSHGKII